MGPRPRVGAGGDPNTPTILGDWIGSLFLQASSWPYWTLLPQGQDSLAHCVTPRLAQGPDRTDVTGVPSWRHRNALGPPPYWLVERAWCLLGLLWAWLGSAARHLARRAPPAEAREPASEGAITEKSLSPLSLLKQQ